MRSSNLDGFTYPISCNSTTSLSNSISSEIESVLRYQPTQLFNENDNELPILLHFLSYLADSELSVRRASLVVLNTAAHHKPNLIRPLLNLPIKSGSDQLLTVLDLLYAQTIIRKELIREVEMGPFKHHEDDGLDLRKVSFFRN